MSAERGHSGAMVALGNLALAAADAAAAEAAEPPEAVPRAGVALPAAALVGLGLNFAVHWYQAAASAAPPHPDALFNLGQVRGLCAGPLTGCRSWVTARGPNRNILVPFVAVLGLHHF